MYAALPGAFIAFAGPVLALDAGEIVKRSVQVTEVNWAESPHYSYVIRDTNRTQKSVKTFEVSMIAGSPYRKLIAENDAPLPEARQMQEEQKLRHEIRKRQDESGSERRRRLSKYEEDRQRDRTLLIELGEAFDYTLVGQLRIQNYATWEVQGTPKEDYTPPNRDAKVLAGMKVTLWIDKATYQWVKVQAEVLKPVSLWGALAKIGPGTRFELEQEPVSSHVWLPKHFTMDVNASALGFLNKDISEDHQYKSYQRTPEMNAVLEEK